MGKVGTGWSRTVSSQIRKQLDTVITPKSKLTKPIKKPKATWVEPHFFAEVEYRDITSEGLLRASSFKGPSKGTERNLEHWYTGPESPLKTWPGHGLVSKPPNPRTRPRSLERRKNGHEARSATAARSIWINRAN